MKINIKSLVMLIFLGLVGFINAQTNFTMNEIYSRGTTSDPDWIEIYNLTNAAIDISGYKIYDIGGQSGTKPKKVFPSGSTIPANGFLVVVVDDTTASGFGLTSNGEKVWIEDASGVVVDSVEFPALQTNQSYSRVPNGQNWIITNSITKGSSNIYSNLTTIVINEIFSRGTINDPDWIELYNPSSTPIDISGYKIYDNNGYNGTKPKMEITPGAVINGNGYFVVVTDDSTHASGFGLSSLGEEIWFEDAAGLVIDDVIFPAMDSINSYSRFPDGTSVWYLTTTITKGAANTITDVEDEEISVNDFCLEQNYPNPFNPSTTINYSLPYASNIKIIVYNLIGEVVNELANFTQQAGNYSIRFDADGLSSGIYFYSITANSVDGKQNYNSVRKMTLLK